MSIIQVPDVKTVFGRKNSQTLKRHLFLFEDSCQRNRYPYCKNIGLVTDELAKIDSDNDQFSNLIRLCAFSHKSVSSQKDMILLPKSEGQRIRRVKVPIRTANGIIWETWALKSSRERELRKVG